MLKNFLGICYFISVVILSFSTGGLKLNVLELQLYNYTTTKRSNYVIYWLLLKEI